MGGQDGQLPAQILVDQLTLSHQMGEIVPHPVLGSFLRHW